MDIVRAKPPAVYAYGQDRDHTAGRCPPAYTPLPVPSPETFERWTDEELNEWVRAELRDVQRESGGGW